MIQFLNLNLHQRLRGIIECNYYTSDSEITIKTSNIGSMGTEDGVLDSTTFKIEVYPE